MNKDEELADAIAIACRWAAEEGEHYLRAEEAAYQNLVGVLRSQRREVARLLRKEHPQMSLPDSLLKARELVPSPVLTSRLASLPFYT